MSAMEILINGRTYHLLPGVVFHVHYVPFKHYQGVEFCAWHVNSHERLDIPSDYCLSEARSGSSQLMPSEKHNSRMARARDLISSLINVASSRDVSFHQLQQLQCLHHGAIPLNPFVPHSFFTTTRVVLALSAKWLQWKTQILLRHFLQL